MYLIPESLWTCTWPWQRLCSEAFRHHDPHIHTTFWQKTHGILAVTWCDYHILSVKKRFESQHYSTFRWQHGKGVIDPFIIVHKKCVILFRLLEMGGGCCRLGSCEACCKWSAAQMLLNEWCEFRNSAHGKASTVPPAWAAKDLQLVQHTQQKHPVYSRERCVQGVFVSTIKQVQSQLNCVVVTIITIQLCSFYFSHNFSCVGEVAMS